MMFSGTLQSLSHFSQGATNECLLKHDVPLSRGKHSSLQYKGGNACQRARFLGGSKHNSLLRLTRDKTTGCLTPIYLWKCRWTQLYSGKFGFLNFYRGINHPLTSSCCACNPDSIACFFSFILPLPISVASFAITLLPLTALVLPRTTPFWASSCFLADSGLLESHSFLPAISYSSCSPRYPVKHSLISHHLCCFWWAGVNGSWLADTGGTFLVFWLPPVITQRVTYCHNQKITGNRTPDRF